MDDDWAKRRRQLNTAEPRGRAARGISVTMRGQIPSARANHLRFAEWPAARRPGDLSCCWRQLPVDPVSLGHSSTIPAVLCGVLLMLAAERRPREHSILHAAAIMAIGIAVANSILLVSFASRFRHEGRPLLEAAREGAGPAGCEPILMTPPR